VLIYLNFWTRILNLSDDTRSIIRANLPHIYGWPWYSWAWDFFNSSNRMNLLCAANQISKSSTQIRKAIDWCTNTRKWPKLWPNNPVPRNMWYLYPDSKVATVEFESKWVPEFMPRGPFKDHPVYGWDVVYEKKRIEKIKWKNGVTLHFKTYMQNPQSLQSSTVHAIFCFPKGTEILTRDGVRCISTIGVGDEVMTHRGWRRVKSNMRRESCEVVTRKFSNGQELTGTPDHPVWTLNEGWVGLGQLTPDHVCYSVPQWRMRMIKRLFRLEAACTSVSQTAKISVYVDALFAKLISRLAWTYKPAHVLSPVEASYREETVYNLNVEDAHTYFSQSLLVHNCDEELPENIYDELQFRLAGTDGHFHMVFTATLNQKLWWQAMEGSGEEEKFPDAFKQQISMYNCQRYRNGSKGAFDDERIRKIISQCKSDNEVKRRVYGRFIADTGRKYPAFDPSRHFVTPFPIEPGKWHLYGGVDPGGGGATGHPAAMGIIAVRSDYRLAYVVRGFRMDGEDTTSGDILNKFREMRGSWTLRNQFYDQASKDFHIVSSRAGESFTKSEKSHELGEDIVNTLFKNDMLFIFDTSDLRKLGQELVTLRTDIVKRKAADDFIDGAIRYPCCGIGWDWTAITGEESEESKEVKAASRRTFTAEEYDEWVEKQRRGTIDAEREKRNNPESRDSAAWDAEWKFWNEQYGS